MNQTASTVEKTDRWTIFFITAAVVLGLWFLNWLLLTVFVPDWPERGTFGDMFGAINALFSGLAFAGVIYTIWLQTRELELQRQELAATREELKRSADAQEETRGALNKQVHLQALSASISSNIAILEQTRLLDREEGRSTAEFTKVSITNIYDLATELNRILGETRDDFNSG